MRSYNTHFMGKSSSHTAVLVTGVTITVAALIVFALLLINRSAYSATHHNEVTGQTQAEAEGVSTDVSAQTNASSSSGTSSDDNKPTMSLTVNGQPLDVPESGSTHQTVKNNDGDSKTDVSVSNHSSVKTTVKGSTSNSTHLSVTTTTSNSGSDSSDTNTKNGMPGMPPMPPMP